MIVIIFKQVIYSRSSDEVLTHTATVPVLYHCTNPSFYDEVNHSSSSPLPCYIMSPSLLFISDKDPAAYSGQ